MSEMIYTHIAHGGAYTVVGVAKGAGKSKLIEPLTIYRDMTSGELYFRTAEDFNDIIRPAALAPIPEQVAQATILATWPERIWLQYGESEPETYPGAGSEITWCEDNINGAGDVEYVRADLATQSAKQATVAQEVTQQAAKASCIEGLMRYGIGRIGDLERMADGEAYLVADVERFLAPTTSTVSASGALAAAEDSSRADEDWFFHPNDD